MITVLDFRQPSALGQQRLYLAPQLRVGRIQENHALGWVAIKSGVVEFLDLAPALGSHMPFGLGFILAGIPEAAGYKCGLQSLDAGLHGPMGQLREGEIAPAHPPVVVRAPVLFHVPRRTGLLACNTSEIAA
jgi:hypothetical protein